MSLGENIRRARSACSMTQAALAQALSVSDRAVSRWERSVSMPDASLLPQLALVLRTSTDALVGVAPQRIQADIFQTIDTCTMLLREHKVTEAIDLLRKKAAQYPQQPELMVALARALLKLKTEAAAQESLSLCRSANLQLPAGSPAQPLRLSTIFGSRQVMALALKHLGKREQAAQLVTDEMPAIFVSRELLLARVAPSEQAQRICRSNADLLGTLLQSTLLRLSSKYRRPSIRHCCRQYTGGAQHASSVNQNSSRHITGCCHSLTVLWQSIAASTNGAEVHMLSYRRMGSHQHDRTCRFLPPDFSAVSVLTFPFGYVLMLTTIIPQHAFRRK